MGFYASSLIDCSGDQRMRKLTIISHANDHMLKRVYVSRLLCPETDEAINNLQCQFRNCSLSNQLIPLPLNDDTAVSGGNGVSVSKSEVSAVSDVLVVACKKRVVWLQMCHKKCHKSPFLLTKNRKKSTAIFSISICFTTN